MQTAFDPAGAVQRGSINLALTVQHVDLLEGF